MFIYAIRGLAAATVATVLAAAWLFTSRTPDHAALAFERVLQRVSDADTLHLEIARDGKHGKAWARKPGLLRINRPDGTYQIARAGRLWTIDERANRATSRPVALFSETAGGLDPLRLVQLPPVKDRQRLLKTEPVEQIERDGRACDVYRIEVPAAEGKVQIEALVDARTQSLCWLESRKLRDDGRSQPIARLTVLAVNEPVDEELFVVGDTLTEDGRIGKVTDAQGIVAVRPVMRSRWTPVAGPVILKPGDWLRTDVRGANAVGLRLVKRTGVTLGPGSLVEFPNPRQIKLVSGELKITADKKSPIELLGPGQQKIVVEGAEIYRLDRRTQKLARLDKPPLWLQGFEGNTNNESIGSLVANVDGRNVPLTVGYHKVTVDIRDQIARTVVEESFVNHTDGQLEGVFYFPLPQDASISGFGMWIGNELVEADVVEKQRAREIYETILRERRDPGLLEWTGGNLFKARVFPIFAHSEKRIKITYTQVLPMRGNSYRYSYGLQSELLKQHPLRELSLDVKINSAVPLRKVTSPTHLARIDRTEHSAHVEFSGQEYTPTSDFEVVVEVDRRQSDVVLIPHRRGDDGYFLMQLTPPTDDGQWQRETLPDGEPLELLILADTSGSMDAPSRRNQAEFISTVLGSLTPDDKINLATCDAACDWVFAKPVAADEKNIAAASSFLAGRVSLGWTDLDRAFASALAQCGPDGQVIYIGDGIITTGDADPVAFGKRLRRLCEKEASDAAVPPPISFHAVAVSSSFEPIVLKTIASLGGGSVRQISGEQTPPAVAVELLGEITQPAIRDLKVDFRGIRAARVYPDELPNLPAGMQQIILGRYLPEGADQAGEVIVTGTREGRPVKFSSRVSLKDAERGNSFIPRLWARMHLDSLLQQGASSVIKDEIIALSEEYHIMTPYTSLLVLESDEDRERFKVKRRFQMRDGQKFFTAGRDAADYELLQKQMRAAGNWRLGLRRDMLRQLTLLGRDSQFLRPRPVAGIGGGGRRYADSAGSNGSRAWGIPGFSLGGTINYHWAVSSGGGTLATSGQLGAKSGADDFFSWQDHSRKVAGIEGLAVDEAFELSLGDGQSGEVFDFEEGEELGFERSGEPCFWRGEPMPSSKPMSLRAGNELLDSYSTLGIIAAGERGRLMGGLGLWEVRGEGEMWYGENRRGISLRQQVRELAPDVSWLATLFAHLPPSPPEKPPRPEQPWPADARALVQNLLRSVQLAGLEAGLRIERRTTQFDARWGDQTSVSPSLALVSTKKWLIRNGSDGSQTTVSWCNAKQRGVFSREFQLGRIRASTPLDLSKPPLELQGYLLGSINRAYNAYSAELKTPPDGQTLLVLKHPSTPKSEVHVLVDTDRWVILEIQRRRNGKVTSTIAYRDFVDVAGGWKATRIETTDQQGRRNRLTTMKFTPLAADAFERQLKTEMAGREQVQLLREPPVAVNDAKQAVKDGKADFDDQMALLLHFARSQQWQRVLKHLDEAERLAERKPGMRWARSAVLNQCRRREELKERITREAVKLAALPAAGRGNDLFLANYLIGQSNGILEANEMFALFDALRPVFERQPAHLHGLKTWKEHQIGHLQQAGRTDDELRVQKELAEGYPRDCDLQRQYAHALTRTGEYNAAYAWLERALQSTDRWLPAEEEAIHVTYTDLLQQQGRWTEMVDYLAGWVADDPPTTAAYGRYLAGLIRTDRIDEADTLIAKWIADGQVPGAPEAAAGSRLQSAVSQALGQGHDMHTNRIDEQWLGPLAGAALFFAQHPTHARQADNIMSHWRFQQSDECREVRRKTAEILANQIDALPAARVQSFVNWVWPNDPAVEARAWKRIATGLQRRWSEETDLEVKHRLAQPLVQILSGRLAAAEHLAFLRLQLKTGPERYKATYANQLFNALLGQPWSSEHEDEAFGLLARLSDAKEPEERLLARVTALYRLTDAMVQARNDALMAEVEHQEELTRSELREKKLENLRLAREGFAKRLRRGSAEQPEAIGLWIDAERRYLEVLLGQDLERAAEECWELLGPEPWKTKTENATRQMLDGVLRHRCLATLANLAARRNAKPAAVDRLLKFVDGAIADGEKNKSDNTGWKLFKHNLLIALDRPKDLEAALRSWIPDEQEGGRNSPEQPEDDFTQTGPIPFSVWRISLGYLMAEQGRVKEAIELFERVEREDELGPAQYRALAGWYMVVDRREDHERALISIFKMAEEWQLNNWLSQKVQPWRLHHGRLPDELDKDVLRVFAALFEKSPHPQNYQHRLREFYQGTHDFRLLTSLADALVGHTAGRVYPLLQAMSSVLEEVRDEATADSIVEHLAVVRHRAKTAVDRRALDLLELLVERRGAELLNQPGPHTDLALAAMQRAFKHEWSDGEPRLMADFLAALGAISQKKLADEQIRQLEVLHRQSAEGTLDRLHIAHALANAHWNYSRYPRAIDLLEDALNEYQAACDGILPAEANGVLDTFISRLEARVYHARGEQVLFEQLKHPANGQQTFWLRQRLYRLYDSALSSGGDVSLGAGATLYRAVNEKLQDELETEDHNHRYTLINQLCAFYRTAHKKELDGVAKDLKAFAFQRLPEVLPRQTNNYQSIVSQVAHTLYDLAGARTGLAFLIERIESEPTWFRFNNQDGWSQHGYQLGEWRTRAGSLGELEPRLLAIVIAELRRDLQSRESRNRNMYHRHHGNHYWAAKADDFAATAEKVYARRKRSGAAVKYIADYFFWGLERHARAIEILQIAYRQKILDENGQSKLVDFLHRRERYAESIPVLEPLVARRPENMRYRTWLMYAYFRTDQPAKLLALLKQTDEFFHQEGRWREGAMAALAEICLRTELYERSVSYYDEVISLHQRTQPRRGIGGGTLSSYYGSLARAHAGLKNTAGAVDAACGAIVSWGPRHDQRASALQSLTQVLRDAPNLNGYVAELDRRTAETGLHNPIVRKALGMVHFEKKEYARAIAQLTLACELQPNDAETHNKLIACYDEQDDEQGAIEQVLRSLELSRRDIQLYRNLGERFDELERGEDAERAYTSIVEALPSESESHALLAEIRQKQDRWDEAIVHWRQVARIRALEPTGLLKLAAAQIHQRQWDRAAETLKKLNKSWPSRFTDVQRDVRELQRQIDNGRKTSFSRGDNTRPNHRSTHRYSGPAGPRRDRSGSTKVRRNATYCSGRPPAC